jgi:flagellar assembly factor FliW
MNIKIISPILGFESVKEVMFLEIDDFFSSISGENLSFTLIDPTRLRDYSFKIPSSYQSLLQIEDKDDIKIYSVVVINSEIEKSTINFIAPIVINFSKALLAQITLDSFKYPDFQILDPISNYL